MRHYLLCVYDLLNGVDAAQCVCECDDTQSVIMNAGGPVQRRGSPTLMDVQSDAFDARVHTSSATAGQLAFSAWLRSGSGCDNKTTSTRPRRHATLLQVQPT